MNRQNALTLAELLIAMVLLGVIGAFTIPKVLQSQQTMRYKAVTKADAAAVVAAYQTFLSNGNVIKGTTSMNDLTPYLNYVRYDTTSWMDADPDNGFGVWFCASVSPCYHMPNGSVLEWASADGSFGNTANTNAMFFLVDPDEKSSGSKAQSFYLYTNGNLTTNGGAAPLTCDGNACWPPSSTDDLPWFAWN